MSGSVSDCYPELVNAFENGAYHDKPDTLCASYFFSSAGAASAAVSSVCCPLLVLDLRL